MPDTITPNPPSPFADADPAFRHVLPALVFFGDPEPGGLVLTGCRRMAVVPDEPLRDTPTGGGLPDGLCPACLADMRGETPTGPARPITDCRTCDGRTNHNGVCALCRQEMHADWVVAGRPDGVTLEQTVERTLAEDVADDTPEQQGAAPAAAAGGER